ncbi:hypothetical protein BJ741DRAFT_621480 [Chytriomyces cf. hyalinus JEL632]|nr:hypothetical protein BJ741DRAFT_621480 [Chytriomyces cf. hyalinus JEL632]
MTATNLSAKWFIATFATYFVLRKKIKPWWQKVSKSPVFIFIVIIVCVSVLHHFVLRPYQHDAVGDIPAHHVSVPKAVVPAGAGDAVKVRGSWMDRIGRIGKGFNDMAHPGDRADDEEEEQGNSNREAFEDFVPRDPPPAQAQRRMPRSLEGFLHSVGIHVNG